MGCMIPEARGKKRIPNVKTGSHKERGKQKEGAAAQVLFKTIYRCGLRWMSLFDIVSVGHFSIDSIFLPNRQTAFTVLGGSVAYISFAARRLDARVSVISTVGADFPAAYKWWLEQEGVDLSGVTDLKDVLTTRFELRYNSDLSERTLCSKNRMPPIRIEDLPNPLKARVIHLAPIAGEVTYGGGRETEKLHRSLCPLTRKDSCEISTKTETSLLNSQRTRRILGLDRHLQVQRQGNRNPNRPIRPWFSHKGHAQPRPQNSHRHSGSGGCLGFP